MYLRKVSLAAAFAVTIACAVAMAQQQVTLVTTNGQQYSGNLIYRNGTVGVMTANGLRSVSRSNVAVIEFTPGDPSPDEISQLPTSASTGFGGLLRGSSAVLVLQNGDVISGSLANISSDGSQVSINTSNGRDNYMASDIARLYLNPVAAQRLFASNQMNQGTNGAVGTSGQYGSFNGGRMISVPANQHWTDTGMQVRQGQQIAVRAGGRVHWGPAANQIVGPQGGGGFSGNYPVPSAGVGALIARVGNSQPFALPASGTFNAPANGELYLGINDDDVADNSGNFQVQLSIGG